MAREESEKVRTEEEEEEEEEIGEGLTTRRLWQMLQDMWTSESVKESG